MMKPNKVFAFIGSALWILNPFLLFITFFKESIQMNIGMSWMGKFHPLLLHFPLVFGILIGLYLLFIPAGKLARTIEQPILLINAFFAVIVAITGLLLSKENTYEGDLLTQHQWGGIAIALFSWGLVLINTYSKYFQSNRKIRLSTGILLLALIIVFTHKGAQLTHGIDALSIPENKTTNQDATSIKTLDSTATVYEKAVEPILLDKCVSCHGPKKIKGNLQLDSKEHIQKGGKDGNVFDLTGDASIIERMHLPLTEEKHMPPDGKPQLTPSEIMILQKWISAGGDFNKKMFELNKADSLYILANNYQPTKEKSKQSAGPDLSEYNTNYCNVHYVYPGSTQIEVNFFQGSFYNSAQLKNIEKIKEQVVSLNMQGMPLKEEDLTIIAGFKSLEKLNLKKNILVRKIDSLNKKAIFIEKNCYLNNGHNYLFVNSKEISVDIEVIFLSVNEVAKPKPQITHK